MTMNSITCYYRDKIVWYLVDEICNILQSHWCACNREMFHVVSDRSYLVNWWSVPALFRFYLAGLPSNSGHWRHASSREACSWKEQDLLHQFIGSLPLPVLQRTANVRHALRRFPVRKRNRKSFSSYHDRQKNASIITGLIYVTIIDSFI